MLLNLYDTSLYCFYIYFCIYDGLSEMRIVLLGAQWAARSSSGNTILGRDAFEVNSDCLNRTARCVAEKGEVGGTFVTIVDTPGWFYSNPVQKTANSDKLQIKRSVSLCPPGPHVLLLTVPLATAYNELYHKAVKEHVALLGEDVWRFVIVLFTRGDWIGDTTVEEWIESEGKNLRWLVNKCDNRYHVFDNKNRADNVQVRELLKKIEGLVAVNGGDCYERDRDEDIRLKEQELSIVEEAQKMRITVQRIRTTLKELFKGKYSHCLEFCMQHHYDEIRHHQGDLFLR
uniref:AIG1-type G domain-containing protein n=1 Tax=Denticeps clupeoides TaxID=299321 RepID=A0AAY4BFW8_9TELE